MTVTIVGSRRMQLMPIVVVDFLSRLPPSAVVQLRSGNLSRPGRFERMVAECAKGLWMRVAWCRPDPDGGPGATYDRDVAMVASSDVVLAFFAEDQMSGGTEHVVEKAMDPSRLVPVYSYGMRDGRLVRIGDHDPNESWSLLAPAI